MGEARTRIRSSAFDANTTSGHLQTWKRTKINGVFTPWRLDSTSALVTTNNGCHISKEVCHDVIHPGPPYKIGDALDLIRGINAFRPVYGAGIYERPLVSTNDYTKYVYVGGFTPNLNVFRSFSSIEPRMTEATYNALLVPSLVSDNTVGNGATEKFSPFRPSMNLGQSLVELSDIPRTLKSTASSFMIAWKNAGGQRTFKRSPKHLADAWLNANFGWVPFVSDIINFYKMTRSMGDRLNRLRRYNNAWEKRGGTLSETLSSDVLVNSKIDCGLSPTRINSVFEAKDKFLEIRREIVQTIWFSAHYKYAFPNTMSLKWEIDMITRLAGLELTPSLVYELMPWSWLLDWGTNLGDYLKSIETRRDYATRFAYIMGRTGVVYKATTGLTLANIPVRAYLHSSVVRKERRRAHPLGFGLSDDNLDVWQSSILASLGLSKYWAWGNKSRRIYIPRQARNLIKKRRTY